MLSEEAQSVRGQAVAIVIVDCYCWDKMCLWSKNTTNMTYALHTMQADSITRCIKKHDQCVAKHLQLLLLLLLLFVDGIVIVVAVAIC